MEKQNLFTEEELAKVTDEAERKHLIECAQDQSKIDMKYMEIMSKYDLWEKGKRSRYFHATTHEFHRMHDKTEKIKPKQGASPVDEGRQPSS